MLTFKTNEKVFQKAMRGFAKDIPKAHAISLTWTAKDAQKDLQDDLDRTFIVRRPWIKRSIRIKGARAPSKMFAEVGSIDDYMPIHEKGGTRRSTDTKKQSRLAVPIDVRKNITKVITRKKWPGVLLKNTPRGGKKPAARGEKPKKPDFFIFESKRKRAWLIAKRKGRKTWKKKKRGSGGKAERAPIKIFYALKKETRIRKRWDFSGVVFKSVKENWPKNALKAIKLILDKRRGQ